MNGPHLPLARCPSAAAQLLPSNRSTHCAAFLSARGQQCGTLLTEGRGCGYDIKSETIVLYLVKLPGDAEPLESLIVIPFAPFLDQQLVSNIGR